MKPTSANEKIIVSAEIVGGNSASSLKEIGSFVTDSQARFEFKYKAQEGSSTTLTDAFHGRLQGLPLNQNLTRDPWYISSLGKLKINCNLNGLKPSDTLYIAYSRFSNGSFKQLVKFYTNIPFNYSFELQEPLSNDFELVWGVNEQFGYYEDNGDNIVTKFHKFLKTVIIGDPIFDEALLEY